MYFLVKYSLLVWPWWKNPWAPILSLHRKPNRRHLSVFQTETWYYLSEFFYALQRKKKNFISFSSFLSVGISYFSRRHWRCDLCHQFAFLEHLAGNKYVYLVGNTDRAGDKSCDKAVWKQCVTGFYNIMGTECGRLFKPFRATYSW